MRSTVNQLKQELNITEDNFIGIFLYGSQNYNLDYENSDLDTICLVREANVSKQEKQMSCGIVKIYTLKYFIYRLKQGDLECYEILYTKFRVLNPRYSEVFINFVNRFSECMSYDRLKHSLYLKLNEHLCSVLWMLKNKEKARYNKKRLYMAIRVCNQLERLNAGETFEASLVYKSLQEYDLKKIKTQTNYLSIPEFSTIYKYLATYLYSLPRYSKKILNTEIICLSNFYEEITSIIHY